MLLSDQPAKEAEDALDFAALAKHLGSLILGSSSSTPFSIGIEADWGMGKSTLMERLRKDLEEDHHVNTVWFNAWTSEGSDALEGLIKSVLDKLDPNILRRTLRNQKLMNWARALASLVASLLRLGN